MLRATQHDRSHIAGILLQAHGLTVKLSPCPCSHSSPPGRIAHACLYGHSKIQSATRPGSMIQHLYSQRGSTVLHLCICGIFPTVQSDRSDSVMQPNEASQSHTSHTTSSTDSYYLHWLHGVSSKTTSNLIGYTKFLCIHCNTHNCTDKKCSIS